MESIVTYHATAVSPKAIQKRAEESYANGFFCCEAAKDVIRTVFRWT